METIIRNVRDLKVSERSAAEQIVGHELDENQQLVIVIKHSNGSVTPKASEGTPAELPDWCDVYKGLSDQEIDDLEKVILTRANLSRPAE